MATPFVPTSNEERAAMGDIFAYGGNMINAGNNTTTPVAPTLPKTTTPTVLSTAQGANYVQKDQQTLAKLSGAPTTGIDTRYQLQPNETIDQYNQRVKQYYTQPTPQTQPTTKQTTPEGSITYINPNTDQTQTLSISGLTPDNVATLKSQGYQIADSNGAVPAWVLSGNIELGRAQQDLQNTEATFNDLKNNITKYTISDADLQNQIASITAQWDARINEMKDINRRRTQSLETTGVRLGSRYTGGAGGVFGGIVSEEERQGVARIGELEAQKQAAISAAKEAARAKNWEIYSKQVAAAESVYQQKLKTVEELNKLAVENNKKIQEAQIQSSRDSAIADVYSQGITSIADLLDTLNYDDNGKLVGDFTAKEIGNVVSEITKQANSELQGVVKEWQSAVNTGGVPPETTLEEYLNIKDPTRALRLQKLGLDISKVQNQVAKQVGQKATTQSILTPLQRTSLNASGIDDNIASQITLAILGGNTLESIRQALKADGLSPAILDRYDAVVNIKGLLQKQQFKSSTSKVSASGQTP